MSTLTNLKDKIKKVFSLSAELLAFRLFLFIILPCVFFGVVCALAFLIRNFTNFSSTSDQIYLSYKVFFGRSGGLQFFIAFLCPLVFFMICVLVRTLYSWGRIAPSVFLKQRVLFYRSYRRTLRGFLSSQGLWGMLIGLSLAFSLLVLKIEITEVKVTIRLERREQAENDLQARLVARQDEFVAWRDAKLSECKARRDADTAIKLLERRIKVEAQNERMRNFITPVVGVIGTYCAFHLILGLATCNPYELFEVGVWIGVEVITWFS